MNEESKMAFFALQMFKTIESDKLNIDYVITANNILDRNKIFELLSHIDNVYLIIQIEKSIFEFTLNYIINKNLNHNMIEDVYYNKLFFICGNLEENDNIDNKTLLNNLLNNVIPPEYIAFLTPQHLHSERWKPISNKFLAKEKTLNNITFTDIYKCNKCHNKKFIVSHLQTRSCDEPITTFATCLVCHHTIKH